MASRTVARCRRRSASSPSPPPGSASVSCAPALYDELVAVSTECAVFGAAVCFMGSYAHWAGVAAAALGRVDDAAGRISSGAATVHAGWAQRRGKRRRGPRWRRCTDRRRGGERRACPSKTRLGCPRSARPSTSSASKQPRSFRPAGPVWELDFAGRAASIPDARGLRDIAVLLARPGRPVPVTSSWADTGRARPRAFAGPQRSTNGHDERSAASSGSSTQRSTTPSRPTTASAPRWPASGARRWPRRSPGISDSAAAPAASTTPWSGPARPSPPAFAGRSAGSSRCPSRAGPAPRTGRSSPARCACTTPPSRCAGPPEPRRDATADVAPSLMNTRREEALATSRRHDQMELDQQRLEAFMHQFAGDFGAAMHAATVVVGDKLGLYAALAEIGPTDAAGLASRHGVRPPPRRGVAPRPVRLGLLPVQPGDRPLLAHARTDRRARRSRPPARSSSAP